MSKFPFDTWGKVAKTPQAGRIERVKVVRSSGGGFLICTVENGAEYDVWVETAEEVEADLAELSIEWPSGDGA